MPPESVVIRYISVKKLALRGVAGERENARRILSRMELEYPGIKQAAAQVEAQQQFSGSERSRTAAPTPPPNVDGDFWQEFFRYASSAWHGVRGFAETVTNVAAGRELGRHVRSGSKFSQAGNLIISLRLSPAVLHEVVKLNYVQLQAFRDALHAHLDEELDQIFGVVEEDEED